MKEMAVFFGTKYYEFNSRYVQFEVKASEKLLQPVTVKFGKRTGLRLLFQDVLASSTLASPVLYYRNNRIYCCYHHRFISVLGDQETEA